MILYWERVESGSDRVLVRFCENGEWKFLREEGEKGIFVRRYLEKCGLPMPEVLEVGEGYIVEECPSFITLYSLWTSGGKFEEAYRSAVRGLLRLASSPPGPLEERDWEEDLFYYERESGKKVPDELRTELLRTADRLKRVPTLRDCQSTNLLVGERGVFFVDVQSACAGPIGYDLASLLEDPYVDVPRSLKLSMREEFGASSPEYEILALLRHYQCAAAYFKLCRKGKKWFCNFIEKTLGLIEEEERGVREWLS